ncbi:nucleotidyltransferase family protein [Luminiphilus sp.]|jgi:molybdenum cofactor cytidylyltransferase|nr:nucleotidyltransferase family protein [Luminiphilus sp.]MDC3197435.1 nucleotidyltransferase family protein [Luminiphilus sp.]MDC3393206.1 nucleotidyltransferase family protein [Luminiphilus sp.]
MAKLKLGIVILAAGAASRFGRCKQLAEFQHKPLLQHVIDEAKQLNAQELVVVTGRWHDAISEAQRNGTISSVTLIKNDRWQQGMSSSIALATECIADSCDQLLVLLSDQILVTADQLKALVELAGAGNACASFKNTLGPPAVFSAALFPSLLTLSEAVGAKQLLLNPDSTVRKMRLDAAAWDIDTPEDLEQLSDSSAYTFGN